MLCVVECCGSSSVHGMYDMIVRTKRENDELLIVDSERQWPDVD